MPTTEIIEAAEVSSTPVASSQDGSSLNRIEGSGWVSGSEKDDMIIGSDGDDEIHAPLGNDVIDGGAGTDTLVVYEGSSEDFTVTKLAAGDFVVRGPGLKAFVHATFKA